MSSFSFGRAQEGRVAVENIDYCIRLKPINELQNSMCIWGTDLNFIEIINRLVIGWYVYTLYK